jgi:Glutathione-dependent formaldehyde-activating enzyme
MPVIAVGASARPGQRMRSMDRVVHIAGEPEIVVTPSASGKGRKVARCPACRVAVWSNYPQAGPAVRFVRVGTMDNPDLCPPDIHIFTSSKQPWVTLPAGARAVPEFYDLRCGLAGREFGAPPAHAGESIADVVNRSGFFCRCIIRATRAAHAMLTAIRRAPSASIRSRRVKRGSPKPTQAAPVPLHPGWL